MKTIVFAIAALIGITTGAAASGPKTRTVRTANYDKVMVSGDFNVKLVYGKEGRITVSGDRREMNELVIASDGKTLKIYPKKDFRKSCDNLKSIEVTVPFESLDEVVLAGSGRIVGEETIKAQVLNANLSGPGKMILHVEAYETKAFLSGSGKILLSGSTAKFVSTVSGDGGLLAYGLQSAAAEATILGAGNSEVFSTESITANVSGSGRINYKGNPATEKTFVSGTGFISKP